MFIPACGGIAGSATVEPVAEPDLDLKGILLGPLCGRACLLKSPISRNITGHSPVALPRPMDGDALNIQLHVEVCPTHGVCLSSITKLLVIILPGLARKLLG